jgi:hypothetical protein
VFDYGLQYEQVDLAVQGISALILFRVPQSGLVQARGRTGRVCSGKYWTVTEVKAGKDAECTLEFLPGRPCRTAARLNSLDLNALPQPINIYSAYVEAFQQRLFSRITGRQYYPGKPQVLDVVELFSVNGRGRRELACTVLVELQSIDSQLHSLARDDDWKGFVRSFRETEHHPLKSAQHMLDQVLVRTNVLGNSGKLIKRWLSKYEETPYEFDFSFDTSQVKYGLALCLWKTVAAYDVRTNMFTSSFRQFQVAGQAGHPEHNCTVVLLGLSLDRTVLKYRTYVEISDEIFEQLSIELQEEEVFPILHQELGLVERHALTIASERDARGNESRKLQLKRGGKTDVYQPQDLSAIISHIRRSVQAVAHEGKTFLTTQGCPMSSTFSFSVLNAHTMAAALPNRSRVDRGFGDDFFGQGTLHELEETLKNREAIRLKTKWEATGLVQAKPVEHQARLPLAVYTERFLNLESLTFVNSAKPRGLLNLFRSNNPGHVMIAGETFARDYEDAASTLAARLPDYWNACSSIYDGVEIDPRVARRETETRLAVLQAFSADIHEAETIVSPQGAEMLLSTCEAALLQLHPSMKGTPERVLQRDRWIRFPIISLQRARLLLEALDAPERPFGPFNPRLVRAHTKGSLGRVLSDYVDNNDDLPEELGTFDQKASFLLPGSRVLSVNTWMERLRQGDFPTGPAYCGLEE